MDNGQKICAVNQATWAFQWGYDTNNGLVASVSNAAVSEFVAYDAMDRATNVTWKKADGATVRGFGYAFDAAGMITNVTREDGSRIAYDYDSLDRLTSEKQYSPSGALSNSASWTYDLAGNRLAAVTNGVTNLYVYGSGNHLTNFGPNTLVQYDLAGNTTNLQYSASRKLGLLWNGRYELTEARTNGVSAEKYEYDALGRRVRVVSGTTTNTLVYDGPHVIAEWSNSVLSRVYAYGPGVDNVLAMTVYGAATNTYFYLKDHLGSVHALVATNGAIVEQYRYTAWGQTTVLGSNGTVLAASAYGNRYCWQGREYSWKSGLYYFRARWYDPVTGRWLSNDPIGISGGLNQYVFCANNPVNFRDPFGLCGNESQPSIFGFGDLPPGLGYVNSPSSSWMYAPASIANLLPLAVNSVGGAINWAINSINWDSPSAPYQAIAVIAGASVPAEALGASGPLFGRFGAGVLNNNPVLRVGWGWRGSAQSGEEVFRVAWGSRGSWIHGHLDIWPLF